MFRSVFLTLSLLVTLTFADPIQSPSGHADVRTPAKQLVSDVRNLVAQAKEGRNLDELLQDVLHLQAAASDLVQVLPDHASECETSSIIKMAAAGIGSHDSMLLLLADDELSMLNGRLSQSLSFLDRVAQQLQDELAVSNEFGSHLAAIVFGTEVTQSILMRADEVITSIINDNNDNNINGDSNLLLSNGWSVSQDNKPYWQSTIGQVTFDVTPSKPDDVKKVRTKRQSSIYVKPFYTDKKGLGADLGYKYDYTGGSFSAGASWSTKADWGAHLKFTFKF